MAAARNTQIEGWRAIAVLGVMWLHWAPRAWRGEWPFEIGLYFFLTLSGFFITRVLLRDRDRGEAGSGPWRTRAFVEFQKRRALRILVPCYAAMLFAMLVGAPDILANPLWYFTHLANFHIARLAEWPAGTAHFWTLAIQQQFYLLWPLLIYLTPRRALPPALAGIALIAPLSRGILLHQFPEIPNPGAITLCALDYFGIGGLLGLAAERGLVPADRRLRLATWLGFAGWAVLYVFDSLDRPLPVFRHFQQSLLPIAMSGLIVATLAGLPGILGRALEHPALQHLGRISYGLYLFHAAVPLGLGYLAPFLWGHPGLPLHLFRLLVFFLVSWALAWWCHRHLERPLERLRGKPTGTPAPAVR